MKRTWIPIALFAGLGILSAIALSIVSVANMVDYEVLSYQVQYLDNQGVTFRVFFGITNPSGYDLEVWDQQYDIFVAGYKVSEVTSANRYKLLADNTSVVPLDVHLKWDDIQQKIAPISSQSSVTTIGSLPVLIKGKLAAKLGIFKVTRFPVRASMLLSNFLP